MQRTKGRLIGTCPKCGEPVYWYRSRRSGGRYCRCENPDCDFSGPMPRRGLLVETGSCCGRYEGVLVGVEINPTDNPADARRYFWVASGDPRACNQCRNYSHCGDLDGAIAMLDDEESWGRQ
ncbi:MAG: hypothetical protein ACTSU5_18840 [Promethearchaeota archaeon]